MRGQLGFFQDYLFYTAPDLLSLNFILAGCLLAQPSTVTIPNVSYPLEKVWAGGSAASWQ